MCGKLEKVQRRATKYILALPFKSDITYKSRLVTLKMLPLSYWHEYLDVLFLFKCTRGFTITDLDIMPEQANKVNLTMSLRTVSDSLITYHVPKTKTLCQQNSYVVRVARIWNTLPEELREPDISFTSFKNMLLNYYMRATGTIFDLDKPQSWKTVCLKCHHARHLLTPKVCCYLLVSLETIYITHCLYMLFILCKCSCAVLYLCVKLCIMCFVLVKPGRQRNWPTLC